MVTDAVYLWLESRTGESYYLDEEINSLLKKDMIVMDTDQWEFSLSKILKKMNECLDAIDEFWREIPDDLPSRSRMKQDYREHIMDGAHGILADAFNSLGLTIPGELMSSDIILFVNSANSLLDLVRELKENDIEDVIKSQWYDKYNDTHDDILIERMKIAKQDLPDISVAIDTVMEIHSDEDED